LGKEETLRQRVMNKEQTLPLIFGYLIYAMVTNGRVPANGYQNTYLKKEGNKSN